MQLHSIAFAFRPSSSVRHNPFLRRFHALGPIYYRSSNGALLVYDVTDDESFRKVRLIPSHHSHYCVWHNCIVTPRVLIFRIRIRLSQVKNWVKELQRQLGTDIVLTIVGNKIDLLATTANGQVHHVPADEAEAYARSVGAQHFRTSAKENCGVEELFYELANTMIAASDRQRATAAAAASVAQQSSLRRSGSRRTAGGSLGGGGLRVEGANDDDFGANGVILGAEPAPAPQSRCCGGSSGGGGEGDAVDRT